MGLAFASTMMAVIVLLAAPTEARLCNATDPADLPFTTGCDFCNQSITTGFNGCFNGGVCYRQVGIFFFGSRWSFFFFLQTRVLPHCNKPGQVRWCLHHVLLRT